ncbi:MAG: SDR family oxidoreductase [Blastocatellia bacterium]|nr:SDR family oxidoreductase [Blastocatellia bacterium]
MTKSTNKTCLITGANSGIGKVTAHALAASGAAVIMVCRDRARGEAAREEIRRATNNGRIELLTADLSEQRQIRELAEHVKKRFSELHVLINNAGVWRDKRELTADGIESTWAINHLAYFLLTRELLDLLQASAPARIVNVSSDYHFRGHLAQDDVQLSRGYSGGRAYGQSKLANVVFTYELARRLAGTGVTANCLHPGAVNTNFFNNVKGLFGLLTSIGRPFLRSPEKGAETVIWLATAPEVEGVSGKYFFNCKEKRSSRESYDPAVAAKVWEISELMTEARPS